MISLIIKGSRLQAGHELVKRLPAHAPWFSIKRETGHGETVALVHDDATRAVCDWYLEDLHAPAPRPIGSLLHYNLDVANKATSGYLNKPLRSEREAQAELDSRPLMIEDSRLANSLGLRPGDALPPKRA